MSIWSKIKVGINELMNTKGPRGLASRALAPGWGSCSRCLTAWLHVDHVDVTYGKGRGCFALCVECWEKCDTTERQYHYLQLLNSWPAGAVSSEEIKTLCDNITAMGLALAPGTRVKFEWLPAIAWIGPGPFGSHPNGWKYQIYTGTIQSASGLRHKHGHPDCEKVMHYEITPDDPTLSGTWTDMNGKRRAVGVDAFPLEVIS